MEAHKGACRTDIYGESSDKELRQLPWNLLFLNGNQIAKYFFFRNAIKH
jgi:hypothetical protein